MIVLERFAEHFISECPIISLWVTETIVLMLFIASPILIFIIFTQRYNKGRYIFEKKATATGGAEKLYRASSAILFQNFRSFPQIFQFSGFLLWIAHISDGDFLVTGGL